MEIRRFIFNLLSENTLILSGMPGKCVIVDPGFNSPEERGTLLDYLSTASLIPDAVLLTHGHMDHVYGVAELQRLYGMPVYMSDADWPVLEYFQLVA